MASTIQNGQTCLEARGMTERHTEMARSDYNRENQYSEVHPNAISDGDPKGKGTQHGGHGDYLPDCTKPTGMIDYSNFDTFNGGGQWDIEGRNGIGGRKWAEARSLYNREDQYSLAVVDTSENVKDGQWVNKS